jgi:hypothetical protein
MMLAQLFSLYNLIRRETRTMRKPVAKQPRQRASAFVLESLEHRVLLSATPMDVTTTEPIVTAAVVTTDKADYSPGETALITTSNTSADGLKFGDGELVQFQVTRTDGIEDFAMGNVPWFVTDGVGGFNAYQEFDANGQAIDRNADGMADWILPDNDGTGNGSISTNWFVEDQYLGASLLLTAAGQTSGAVATTEFTDSATATTSISPASVSFSSTTAFTLMVTNTSTNPGGQPTMGSIRIAIPAGMTLVGTPTIAAYDSAGTGLPVSWTYDSAASTSTLLSFKSTGAATNQIDRPNGHADITFSATATALGNQTFTTSAWNNTTYSAAGSFTVVSPVVNVAAASITPTFSASNKTYNGDNVASVTYTGPTPAGVTVNYANATFSNENVGTGKTVTISGISLSGGNAGFYTLSTNSVTTTANIAARALTVSATGVNKVYNGDATATVTLSDNRVSGDLFTASYTSATFADKNVGTGKTVSVSGITITGTDAGNYSFNTTASTTATIAQADANVSINPYSGTYDAAAHNLTGSVTGVDAGSAALGSSLTFGSSVTDAPGGTGSWTFEGGTNYLDESGSAAIVINKADLAITVGSVTKTFGQTINLANILGTTINTGVNGENLSISHTFAGTQAAALVGDYAINCVVGSGTGLLSNYNVTVKPGTVTVMTPSVITTVRDGANLIIVGTGGCDTIAVNATNPSAITVNGVGSYSVGASGHVIVYGMASDDNISLTGNINIEAHGGDGNDTITGGAGHDVIFGDRGNDTLTGAAGNDVLVGGAGSDRLVGSAGHDILISGDMVGNHNGGAYNYDTLRQIGDNWAADWSADTDLGNNSDGDVVDEAGSADQLTGSSGHDWFIIGSTDKITDINSATKDGDNITKIT